MRIGKSTLHVAEEFALKEGFRNGTGIYRHHRLLAPEAPGVNLPGQHILAATIFASNEHCGVSGRNLIDGLPDHGHSAGGAPIHRSFASLRMTRITCHSEAGGRRISPHRLPGLIPSGGERGHQLLIIPRLHDEVKRPALHPFHGQLNIGISGEQHHFHLRHHLLNFPGPVQPLIAGIDRGIEVHIKQHNIRPEVLQRRNQRHRRRQRLHLREMYRQQYLQRLANAGVIVHNQNPSFLRGHKQEQIRIYSLTCRTSPLSAATTSFQCSV